MAKKKSKSMGWRGQVVGVFLLLTAIVFMPSTILLLFGMMPTIVVAAFDKAKKKTKAMTIGAMNIAGCIPFLLHLWGMGHDVDNAIIIITDPRTIIVMWSMAGMGYLIDWAMSGIVAKLMLDRGTNRVEDIRKQKQDLIDRWGKEVTGEIPLDPYGFPVESYVAEKEQEQAVAAKSKKKK